MDVKRLETGAVAGTSLSSTRDKRKKTLRSSSYGDAVVKSLQVLRKNDEFCDFTVCAQGKSIRVHKVLLVGMSDYFRAMLLGPMRESQEDRVELRGLTAESLQLIIDFLYSGSVQLDLENLIEVLTASSHLQVQAALDLCSDFMVALINFGNADELLGIADTYSLNRVTDFYTNKVLTNFEEFSRSKQFLNLTAPQLSEYLRDDRLRIHSELALYEPIGRWYSQDMATRNRHLDELLQRIRFGLISETHLISTLPQNWLSTNYLEAMHYIRKGLDFHKAIKEGHPPQEAIDSYGRVRATQPDLVFIHQGCSYKPFEVTSYDHQQDRFFQLATDISGSRDCRVAVIDNFAYICRVVDCGGGTLMNSLLRFDPRHLSLQEIIPSRRLRLDPALVAIGKMLYVFGGITENFIVLDAVECYSVETNSWTDLPALGVATHSLAAVATSEGGGAVFLSGGLEAGNRQPVKTMTQFSIKERSWQSRAPMHFARRLHEMVLLKNKIYVLGGISDHTTFHQQTQQISIECYSIAADQWTMLSSTLPGRAVGHFVTFGDAILSIGREHHEATEEEIWRYDVEEDSWTTHARVPRRSGLAGVTAASLHINFYDEKISRNLIRDKR